MNSRYILLFFLSLSFASGFCQSSHSVFADSAIAFKSFYKGGSTANLHYYSNALDTMNRIPQIAITSFDLDTLNFLIKNVNSKKHHQRKVGPCYYSYVYNKGKLHKVAVIPDYGFIDLSTNLEYDLRNTKYTQALNRLISRNYR